MRFIHTADWHLGCQLHHKQLIDDQEYVLEQFVALAKERKPDAIVLAGDIYDRAVPSTDAVGLLDETLYRLAGELGIPTILIAGNHDGPERLNFGSRLLAGQQLHVFATFSVIPPHLEFHDQYGHIWFYPLAYADPPVVRQHFPSATNHDAAARAHLQQVRNVRPEGVRSVLITHSFVAGGIICDSERIIAVGGAGLVGADCFDGFDYVALGHLHRPQSIMENQVEYPGSLLKYSFSESDHSKSVSVVEMNAEGQCHVERVRLSTNHNVRIIKGRLEELLRRPDGHMDRDDYVQAILLDEGALLDPMEKLRQVYPNVLAMEKPSLSVGNLQNLGTNHRTRSEDSLFEDFFCQVTGRNLNDEEKSEMADVFAAFRRQEREA